MKNMIDKINENIFSPVDVSLPAMSFKVKIKMNRLAKINRCKYQLNSNPRLVHLNHLLHFDCEFLLQQSNAMLNNK